MTRPRLKRFAFLVVTAAAFVLAHTQAPLFYSNQNQYFLHGLARAGAGDLGSDWLANTRDPTPLFSALVEVTARRLPLAAFDAYFALVLCVYWWSVVWLAAATFGGGWRAGRWWLFAGLFISSHAAITRWASGQLTGVDYPWYLQTGLAGQYLLGPGLQPSTAGVLLLTSFAAYAAGRPATATVLAALAGVLHSTYLPAAAMVVGGIVVDQADRAGLWKAVRYGLLAAAVVTPSVFYIWWTFGVTAGDAGPDARRILAEVRIPHHAVIRRWLDGIALAQLGWISFGIALLRRRPLATVTVVAILLGSLLTLATAATGSHGLALLFPWRISAALVPMATAVILAWLVDRPMERRWFGWLGGVLILAAAAGGVWITLLRVGYRTEPAEEPLYEFVRANRRPGDVYLLPVRLPVQSDAGRGSVSLTFTEPPKQTGVINTIPVDLQCFRLATGAAIYVDFKSIPYAADEVLEWRRRMVKAEGWYRHGGWHASELQSEGITHVVMPADRSPGSGDLQKQFEGGGYAVYLVSGTAGPG